MPVQAPATDSGYAVQLAPATLDFNPRTREGCDDDYGMELERFVGKTPNDGISQTLLFQYIKEGLLVNPYIKRVTAAGVTRTKKKIIMKLSVTTIYGKAEIETEV